MNGFREGIQSHVSLLAMVLVTWRSVVMIKCAPLRWLCYELSLNGGHLHGPPRSVKKGDRPLTSYSVEMRQDLAEKILPYWQDTTLDRINGGYTLADDLQKTRAATEKQIVTQSRLIWTFSHVHRKGYSTAQRNYLKVAEHGYRFLIDKFLDKGDGG